MDGGRGREREGGREVRERGRERGREREGELHILRREKIGGED